MTDCPGIRTVAKGEHMMQVPLAYIATNARFVPGEDGPDDEGLVLVDWEVMEVTCCRCGGLSTVFCVDDVIVHGGYSHVIQNGFTEGPICATCSHESGRPF